MSPYKIVLADLYLTWFNDFLTVPAFASYLETSEENAQAIIDLGRQYHEERAS